MLTAGFMSPIARTTGCRCSTATAGTRPNGTTCTVHVGSTCRIFAIRSAISGSSAREWRSTATHPISGRGSASSTTKVSCWHGSVIHTPVWRRRNSLARTVLPWIRAATSMWVRSPGRCGPACSPTSLVRNRYVPCGNWKRSAERSARFRKPLSNLATWKSSKKPLRDLSVPSPGWRLPRRRGPKSARIRCGEWITRSSKNSPAKWQRASILPSPKSAVYCDAIVDMAQLSLMVNGRSFAVTCEDGQETRIRRLGQYVDAKVTEFVRGIGQVGEARLLLLAALVIADELADAEESLRLERNGSQAVDAKAAAAADAVASGLHAIAQRVEAIAARLETS